MFDYIDNVLSNVHIIYKEKYGSIAAASSSLDIVR